MPIYMKYGKIQGPMTGNYKGWIELESCQLGSTEHQFGVGERDKQTRGG